MNAMPRYRTITDAPPTSLQETDQGRRDQIVCVCVAGWIPDTCRPVVNGKPTIERVQTGTYRRCHVCNAGQGN